MSPSSARVEAAGGVLWRPRDADSSGSDGRDGRDGVEVALIHRPAHDDWSLPKGKLDPGEHPLLGALREIEEETGFVATAGRPLGELRYQLGVRPKRVRYWACRARPGSFAANSEVDELRWLTVEDALEMLPAARDRPVLERFASDRRHTRAFVVVRHASAGDRRAWAGADRDRPLDDRGRGQAVVLGALLQAYDVRRAVAADVVRCRDTLAPFAAAVGVPVTVEPAIAAGRFEVDPSAGVAVALDLAAGPSAALCTQREVIEDLVAGVCDQLGHPIGSMGSMGSMDIGPVAKGSMVVLHLEEGSTGIVARELLAAG